jgi:hypothetical protein
MQQFINANIFTIVLVIIWTLYWKGQALWKSARKTDKYWFIAMLVINTLGILEILYIYVFSKDKKPR